MLNYAVWPHQSPDIVVEDGEALEHDRAVRSRVVQRSAAPEFRLPVVGDVHTHGVAADRQPDARKIHKIRN